MESVKAGSRRGPDIPLTGKAPITPLAKASRVALRYSSKSRIVQSGGADRAVGDMEARRARADFLEQAGLGRGHPHLAATFEPGKECGAPRRVEMRRDLVEQQHRRR